MKLLTSIIVWVRISDYVTYLVLGSTYLVQNKKFKGLLILKQ